MGWNWVITSSKKKTKALLVKLLIVNCLFTSNAI